MDDPRCGDFFLQPQNTLHRRYEALRAFFVEGRPLPDIASQFGYRRSALKSMVCRFRASCRNGMPPPFFFRTAAGGPPVADAVKIKPAPSNPLSPTADS
jgi:hypothetical protein